jgi:zinc transporter ZupT
VVTALIAGGLAALVAGVGVALWTNGTPGGPASSEVAVGLIAGVIMFVVTLAVTGRLARKGLLGEPQRMAGGVGEESATANPDD